MKREARLLLEKACDWRTEKHEVRAIAKDCGNRYNYILDDPEAFGVQDSENLTGQQRELLQTMIKRIESEGLFFEIAETCFQLPAYFAFRVTLVRETKRATAIAAMSQAARTKMLNVAPEKRPLFKTVASLEVVDLGNPTVVRAYSPPRYKVEVEGFWRKIDPNLFGKDIFGNPTKGRTWVRGHLRWRDRPERPSTVFVKRSIASAKAKAAAIVASDPSAFVVGDALPPVFPIEIEPENENAGWLYVMRCPLMDDDVYKVGWCSRPPKTRAEELSKATGVPLAYIVVESWKVEDARQIETTAHQVLAEFRINLRREFFKAPFEKIRAAIISALGTQAAPG
jgi:T5orf172 domain